jgi:ubiquinone/menaquinone biosynthesis C-methylase UbiE
MLEAGMDELLSSMRAIAEITRLRLLFVLSHGEFNVSELTQILGQSQPRISRHLKLMVEAGLLSRYKEGSWVLFRLNDTGRGGALARAVVELLPASDSLLLSDIARLEAVRRQRNEAAEAYFRANAANWETLRRLHVHEEEVERAMCELAGPDKIDTLLDLGTGTARILVLFAGLARQGIGIDQNREMLAMARLAIERAGLRHIQVRQGDIYALPFPNSFADFITIHQVLHYLDEPGRVIIEAARVLKPGGRLMIVDFAPHELEHLRTEHAHRRLGIAESMMHEWLAEAGLTALKSNTLPPANGEGLTVSLWLAERPQRREVVSRLAKTRAKGTVAS